jgi:hypothetical protein
MILSPIKVFFRGSPELGFCSVRHNENPTQGVDFHNSFVGRLWAPWSHGNWPYRPSKSLQNSVTSLGCDFVPLDQIVIVSLNGFRRRVATRHKTQTMPQIDEPSVPLDSWHWIPVRGTPLL